MSIIKSIFINKKKFLKFICYLVAYILAIVLRIIIAVNHDLSGDTLWTLLFYVPENISTILTDIALPNNQPLNTILIKFSTQLFGISRFGIFLPAFVVGVSIPLICAHISYLITKKFFPSLFALLLTSVNPALGCCLKVPVKIFWKKMIRPLNV